MVYEMESISDSLLYNEYNRRIREAKKASDELLNRLDTADICELYNIITSDISKHIFMKALDVYIQNGSGVVVNDWAK